MSKKRSIKGESNAGIILRQPCGYCLKGICTRSPCEHWHPPESQFHKNESGCKAGDKCLFPHHEVDEQPNKKRKKSFDSRNGRKRRQRCCSFHENCSIVGLCLAKRHTKGVKYCGNPKQKVVGSIRRVRFTESTLRQAIIRENKGPSLGKNTSHKSSSAKPLRYEI